MMKYLKLFCLLTCFLAIQLLSAQSEEKVYEITITTVDEEGNKKVKELIIQGDEMSPDDIDELVQAELDGTEKEVDINVNVNASHLGEEPGEDTKTITKIVKKRSSVSEEDKIILDEHDMEIEVKGDKVYINGEEVVEGDFGDKRVRILKLEDGDEDEINEFLEEENIEIGEGEKIFFIEKEESKEGIAFLGVTVGRNVGDGVIISSVVKGTSAEKMGLMAGDKLISINGKEVNAYSSLSKTIKGYLPGEEVKIIYDRGGIQKEAIVELSDYEQYNDNYRWVQRGHAVDGQKRGRHYHPRHHRGNPEQATLGVILIKDESGIVVESIIAQSAAEKAGLLVGDKIVSIDKADMLSIEQLQATIKAHKAGDEINIKVLRDGKKKTFKPILQTRLEKVEIYPKNKSERIERIIIKDRSEEEKSEPLEDKATNGAFKLKSYEMSPNPSNGIFKVNFEMDPLKSGDSFTVRIISVDGKVLREKKYTSFDGTFSEDYDLTDFGKGIFLFQIEKQKQTFTKRFIIEDNK